MPVHSIIVIRTLIEIMELIRTLLLNWWHIIFVKIVYISRIKEHTIILLFSPIFFYPNQIHIVQSLSLIPLLQLRIELPFVYLKLFVSLFWLDTISISSQKMLLSPAYDEVYSTINEYIDDDSNK